jgi:hypothetical protein
MKTHIFLSILFSLLLLSCSNYDHGEYTDILKKLEGEWQEAPGIGYREVWELRKNGLSGAGYMHSGETYSQTETLAIELKDSILVYKATVPDQNEGRTIPFFLQNYSDKSLEFANESHDFPNLIAYELITKNQLIIRVESFSDSTRNFSFKLMRASSGE